MKTAVCMIVRNEEKTLPRCLESLAGLEARLYITDTGSTDGTREIALRHGATLREFPWTDDFSAARNHSISGVAEDWILSLDADDYFPPGEAARIPGHLEGSPKAAFALRYEVREDSSSAPGVKLFRNHVGIRYAGIIHEYIRDSLKRFGPDAVGEMPVLLRHSGYGREETARKLERNRPLLEREWRRSAAAGDRAQTLYVGKKLAENAFARGEPQEGESALRGLLESMAGAGEVYGADWEVTLLTHLLSHCHDSGRETEALSCCLRFEPVFGRHPLYWLYRGISRVRCGLFAEAVGDLESFDRFLQSGRLNLAVPRALLGPELWNYLGICRAALSQPEAAAVAFGRAAAAHPENPEYQARLRLALLSQAHGTHLAEQTVAQP